MQTVNLKSSQANLLLLSYVFAFWADPTLSYPKISLSVPNSP